MVENKTHLIFDERSVIDSCRRAMKLRRDVFGKRYRVFYRGGKYYQHFDVYDHEMGVQYKVEYNIKKQIWTIWEK